MQGGAGRILNNLRAEILHLIPCNNRNWTPTVLDWIITTAHTGQPTQPETTGITGDNRADWRQSGQPAQLWTTGLTHTIGDNLHKRDNCGQLV